MNGITRKFPLDFVTTVLLALLITYLVVWHTPNMSPGKQVTFQLLGSCIVFLNFWFLHHKIPQGDRFTVVHDRDYPDSYYFIGFMMTIMSLVMAINLNFQSNSREEVLTSFSVALISTLVGLVARAIALAASRTELADYRAATERTKSLFDDLSDRIREFTTVAGKGAEALEDFSKNTSEASSSTEQHTTAMNEFAISTQEASSQFSELKEHTSTASIGISEVTSAYTQLNQVAVAGAVAMQRLEASLGALVDGVNDFPPKILVTLGDSMSSISNNFKDGSEIVSKYSEVLQELVNSRITEKGQLDEYLEKLASLSSLHGALAVTISSSKQQIDALSKSVELSTAGMDRVSAPLSSLNRDLVSLAESVPVLVKEVTDAEATNQESMKSTIQSLGKLSDSALHTTEKLGETSASLKELDFESAAKSVSGLSLELGSLDARINSLISEMEHASTFDDRSQMEWGNISRELNKAAEEVQRLRQLSSAYANDMQSITEYSTGLSSNLKESAAAAANIVKSGSPTQPGIDRLVERLDRLLAQQERGFLAKLFRR
jgi:chromosome segregation ATPase